VPDKKGTNRKKGKKVDSLTIKENGQFKEGRQGTFVRKKKKKGGDKKSGFRKRLQRRMGKKLAHKKLLHKNKGGGKMLPSQRSKKKIAWRRGSAG